MRHPCGTLLPRSVLWHHGSTADVFELCCIAVFREYVGWAPPNRGIGAILQATDGVRGLGRHNWTNRHIRTRRSDCGNRDEPLSVLFDKLGP